MKGNLHVALALALGRQPARSDAELIEEVRGLVQEVRVLRERVAEQPVLFEVSA